MTALEVLRVLRQHPLKVLFSRADIAQFCDAPQGAVGRAMGRLVREGLVDRVARGRFTNPFSSYAPEHVAVQLRWPAYLSLEWALSYRSVLSQQAFTFTCVTTHRPTVIEGTRFRFEYERLTGRAFTGYVREEGPFAAGHATLVATAEKALLDWGHFRCLGPQGMPREGVRSFLQDMDPSEIDSRRLREVASRAFGREAPRLLALFDGWLESG